jgi:hypothetical protein
LFEFFFKLKLGVVIHGYLAGLGGGVGTTRDGFWVLLESYFSRAKLNGIYDLKWFTNLPNALFTKCRNRLASGRIKERW